MNRTSAILGALAAAGLWACAAEPSTVDPAGEEAAAGPQVLGVGPSGLPSFVTGVLALAPQPAAWTRPELDLAPALREVTPIFGLSPDQLELRRSWRDELGYGHARFARVFRGLPVVGSELLVHVDDQGVVYAANGDGFAGIALDPTPAVSEEQARGVAVAAPGELRALESRLVWVVPQLTGVAHLAWEVRTEGKDERGGLAAERVYVDAHDGQVVDRHGLVYRAKYRKVYDASNNTLKRQEGGAAVSDQAVNYAYDNTGLAYDCYWNLFGRDSYNGAGGQLISYVHDSMDNNAYWYSNTMNFGDGDGSNFNQYMSRALDVTAHELTHGVVEYEANLAYEYESGALNEGWADIMAATCEAYADGVVSADTWKIGEDIYTPYTAGDALRYMNNPAADGESPDYWPDRYLTEAAPSDYNDRGGVHINAGIANLAYYLAVAGGTHPRVANGINVTALGIANARGPFYRALSTYMTSTSSFQAARLATYQAALDLGGASVAASIEDAWSAVGVPPTWLQNGIAVTPITGNKLTKLYFRIALPAGSMNLRVATTSGSGGMDLYLRQGTPPTTTAYDKVSKNSGTAELVEVVAPAEGVWYVLVNGTAPFSGVRLLASWDEHNLTPPEKPVLPPDAPTP
jgi:vibriolysin